MSTPWSWSGGGRRQVDEGEWSRKVTEMGQGTDKDEKGKKGGHTMTQDNLDCFKAECSIYLSMRSAKFTDEQSSIFFVLLYMKGGSTGSWMQQTLSQLHGQSS